MESYFPCSAVLVMQVVCIYAARSAKRGVKGISNKQSAINVAMCRFSFLFLDIQCKALSQPRHIHRICRMERLPWRPPMSVILPTLSDKDPQVRSVCQNPEAENTRGA
ncbi:hypothetical protein MUK42_10121 [Musa troglodytarum]|uniref:Uncharacterized protein n=1 Tax=Musa troglodytarum TaxID=320322 RepID=A0A9E7FFT1_9LILI|nr:hypothetical protein MUK42_10121 [Musa troglodytarum]